MGFVYVIGIEGFSLVKVGSTHRKPQRRVESLQIGIPFQLKLLKAYPCEHHKLVEQHLHKLLAAYWCRGEWFEVGMDIIEEMFVQAVSAVQYVPLQVPLFTTTDQKNLRAVGENVRRMRQEKHFTQEMLADNCQLSRLSIQQIEDGKQNASLLTFRRIAVALGTTVHVIFDIGPVRETCESQGNF